MLPELSMTKMMSTGAFLVSAVVAAQELLPLDPDAPELPDAPDDDEKRPELPEEPELPDEPDELDPWISSSETD
jgi:hypothetical protein